MSSALKKIPDGYMCDAKGSLVPLNMIKHIDKERDRLVHEIVDDAKMVSEELTAFKSEAMERIEKFVELSGRKYKVKMGGKKGNVTLLSFDGKYKIQRAISEYLVFDERLQVAKALIDDCIKVWTKDSRSELRVLINDAFQVDKQGKVSTQRILGLQRLAIKDKKWLQAMKAISESVQVAGSKTYLRIYERLGNTDQYQPISLDVAAL